MRVERENEALRRVREGFNCTDPNPPVCNDFNFLNYRYCALQKAYGSKPEYVSSMSFADRGVNEPGLSMFRAAQGVTTVGLNELVSDSKRRGAKFQSRPIPNLCPSRVNRVDSVVSVICPVHQ